MAAMMTFAEADAQYEVVRRQYLAGALNDDQYDEQLHRLMVLDETGLWWAKSRENGAWHYYDNSRGDWIAATPPGSSQPAPPAAPRAAKAPEEAKAARPQAAAQAPQGKSGAAHLPQWARVKPGSKPGSKPGAPGAAPVQPAAAGALPRTAQGAPGTSGYSVRAGEARDFEPLGDLTGSMKVLFYLLSLFLPLLGLILFLLYRSKPAESDRAAARVFLILGIVSLVFTAMCITTFFIFESLMVGTGV